MIVVADTSVLINLCRVGHGNLFLLLFQTVTVPPEVAAEFARLTASHPRFAGLSLPEGIRQQSPTTIPALVQSAIGLDAGEAAALREAKMWLMALSELDLKAEDKALAKADRTRSLGEPVKSEPAIAGPAYPYAHPRHWAPFVLIGDSE